MPELNSFVGFSVRYGAVTKNRTRQMVMFGCDGTNHATWTATEWLDDSFTTTYATDQGVKVIGKCTGSCKGKRSIGRFLGDEHPLVKRPL